MDIKLNPKSIRKKLVNNFSVFLWAFIIFIMAIEATVIKESIDIFTDLQRVSDRLQGNNLRINFEFYQQLEERLDANTSYRPEPFIYVSPFGNTTVKAPDNYVPSADLFPEPEPTAPTPDPSTPNPESSNTEDQPAETEPIEQ